MPLSRLTTKFALTVVTLVAYIVACTLTGCNNHSEATTDAQKDNAEFAIVDAETILVGTASWPTTVRTQGTLMADERSVVGAKVAGRIESTAVEIGAKVKTGDVLAKLEQTDFNLLVEQASAQLVEACAAVGLTDQDQVEDLDPTLVPSVMVEQALVEKAKDALLRGERLRTSNAISKSELNTLIAEERVASARYEAAVRLVSAKAALIYVRRAALALAQQNLSDAVITAPFDGVIQERQAAAGAFVQPGSAIVTLVRNTPLRFRGSVPERKAMRIRVGQRILIRIEGSEEPIPAEVTRTSPALDERTRSLRIEADIPNEDGRLRSGLFAEGDIFVNENSETLTIPFAAVGEFAGVHKVWLQEGGKFQQARIEIGRREQDRVEVLGGLAAGDRIVAAYTQGKVGKVAAMTKATELNPR